MVSGAPSFGTSRFAVRPSLYINISGLEPVNPNPEYPKTIEYKYKENLIRIVIWKVEINILIFHCEFGG